MATRTAFQEVGGGIARPPDSDSDLKSSAEQAHLKVLRHIEDRILDNRIKPGDRLPAERELANDIGVSRGSVREALRVLRAMGILESGAGRGPHSGCIVTGQPTAAVGTLLRLHMALAHFDLEEAIDTRIQLEGYAAVRAAARAPDAELERMAKLVEKMANPSLSADAVHALAEEFHVAIVDASGNKLASFLLQGLLKAGVQREMVLASEKLPEWETLVSRVCGEHVVILEKIRRGDGAAAAELLESHIRHFYKDVVGADAGRRPSESPPEP